MYLSLRRMLLYFILNVRSSSHKYLSARRLLEVLVLRIEKLEILPYIHLKRRYLRMHSLRRGSYNVFTILENHCSYLLMTFFWSSQACAISPSASPSAPTA